MAQTRAETLADLLEAYVIVSDQQALIDEAVGRLRDRVASEADLNLNLDEFDADEVAPDEVLAAASMLPFLAEKRVVMVKNAQRWNASQIKTVAEYLADPAPDACLVVAYRESKAGAFAKSPLYVAAKAKHYLLERRGPRYASDYPPWVVKRAREMGLAMDASAAGYLVEAVGTDLVTLIGELDKLTIAYDKGARLDREAVEAMVAPYDKAQLYDYLDSAFAGNLPAAVADLESLLTGSEATVVLFGVAGRLRELITVKALAERGLKPNEIEREVKQPGWRTRKQLEMARRFNLATLIRLFERAVTTEEEMKTSHLDGWLAMDRMTVEICRAVGTG